MGALTKEQLESHVSYSRRMLALSGDPNYIGGTKDEVIVALDDEIRLLRRNLEAEEACHMSNLATMNRESVDYRTEHGRISAERDEWRTLASGLSESLSECTAKLVDVVELLSTVELRCPMLPPGPIGERRCGNCWTCRAGKLLATLDGGSK